MRRRVGGHTDDCARSLVTSVLDRDGGALVDVWGTDFGSGEGERGEGREQGCVGGRARHCSAGWDEVSRRPRIESWGTD